MYRDPRVPIIHPIKRSQRTIFGSQSATYGHRMRRFTRLSTKLPQELNGLAGMLKKASSFVLASLRGSTYRTGKEPVLKGSGWVGEMCTLRLLARYGRAWERHVLACLGVGRGEKSGLFEHPAVYSDGFLTSISIASSLT